MPAPKPRFVSPSKVPHQSRATAEALAIMARLQAGRTIHTTDLLDALASLSVPTKRADRPEGCLYQSPDGSWRHLHAAADDVRLAVAVTAHVVPDAVVTLTLGSAEVEAQLATGPWIGCEWSKDGDIAGAIIGALADLLRLREAKAA